MKQKNTSKVNSQRHGGKNKTCFYTSGTLNRVHLKESKQAEKRALAAVGISAVVSPSLAFACQGQLRSVHLPVFNLCHC